MGLLDTVLFAWADGGEFPRSFVHKGFCVPQFIGMWYELRAKRMREDRICAKYRLYQRYHSLQSSREKKPKAGGKREKRHISFTGKLEVCRFDSRVCCWSLVDDSGTSNDIRYSQT